MFSESDKIELKQSVVPDICKEFIAFANTTGGTVFIGVTDDGNPIGVQDADEVITQLNNMVRDKVRPDLTMYIRYSVESIEDKQIVKVEVDRGLNKPYYLAKNGLKPSGVYVRRGTSSDQASDTAIRQMIRISDGDCYEARRSMEQNLTFSSLKQKFAAYNLPLEEMHMKSLGLLNRDGNYSNLAYILSDQNPSTIKIAVFAGSDMLDFQDRKEFTGALFEQMDRAYDYLHLNNKLGAVFNGLYRSDIRDYPQVALREALINSCVHREYGIQASTQISIFEDRIEFLSPGGLLDGIELEDVLQGLSARRNQRLSNIFYRLELIEAYGTGLQKINHAYKDATEKPKIQVSSNTFKLILPNLKEKQYFVKENADKVYSGGGYMLDIQAKRQQKICSFIKDNGLVSRLQIQEYFKISLATAIRILKEMQENKLIERIGNGKNSRYRAL